MSNKYSYSRISTSNTCALQYDLSYNKHYYLKQQYNYDRTKGQLFHSFAEHYTGDYRDTVNVAYDDVFEKNPDWRQLLTIDQQNQIGESFKSFVWLWDHFYVDKVQYLQREIALDTVIAIPETTLSYTFTGVLDALVDDPNHPIIVDYKTPKNINVSLYKKQLYLYVYLLHIIKGYPIESISAFVYFGNALESEPEKRLASVPITENKVLEAIHEISTRVHTLETTGIEVGEDGKPEANIQRMCTYCQYAGTSYCPVSIIAGCKKKGIGDEQTRTAD